MKDWLSQCVACIKRKSPVGRHHPLGNIPTGHRWDRIAMDILDVCYPTPEGFRYILVIADYFSKWTEAFPMKNKYADTVADILVENIILRRPAVPDLSIASSSLLSVIDPLPMDRLSRHTVAEIRAWPAADRHDLLAVANRDVRVARQNIAEMLLYVDDHAAHLANCASADDDGLTLMSAELLPRLEGGIRAALEEVDSL